MTRVPRDPGIDVLRGLAVVGVVTGHWLGTAVTAPDPVTGAVHLDSPLRTMSDLAPVSWVLQTLGLFCVVAGFAAARSRSSSDEAASAWWWSRLCRLAGPAAALGAALVLVCLALALGGASQSLVLRVLSTATSPLWFLGVHVVLSAATPVLVRLDARYGWRVPAVAAAAAVLLAGVAPVVVCVLLAWWVPWQMGIGMARRPLPRRVALALLVAGVAAVGTLVITGAVPPTAVGVPGADRSNLDQPSVATIALALAQAGAAALMWPVLTRPGRVLDAVRAVGRRAYPVFLAHQCVLVALWLITLPLGPLHGLHDGPGTPGWLAARIGWVLVLAAVLGTALRTRGRVGRSSLSGRPRAE